MVTKKKWLVLFGGAGREQCIERILAEGINVQAIAVPAQRGAKLENVVSKLRALQCSLIEVDRSNMSSVFRSFRGCALLSIGFPYLIPRDLLKLFQPALNVHPTLLPRYRGPTSGAYILLNNEQESGSTVHHMTAEMDRGDIVLQSYVSINPFDTIRSLQRKVYSQEPELVLNAMIALENGARALPQDESQASEFPRARVPEDSKIDPSRPLTDIVNLIRACDPDEFPAFFEYHGQKVGIKLWRLKKPLDESDMI